MTSRQWAEIACAFDTPPERRTKHQFEVASYGLCHAAEATVIPWPEWWDKYHEFSIALAEFCGSNGLYLAPRQTPAGDTLRASLAALFAAMTAAERREVLGGDF